MKKVPSQSLLFFPPDFVSVGWMSYFFSRKIFQNVLVGGEAHPDSPPPPGVPPLPGFPAEIKLKILPYFFAHSEDNICLLAPCFLTP